MDTLLESYGEFVHRFGNAPLSDEVRHHARRALLDWTAALVAGARMSPAMELRRALSDEIGHGRSSVVGTQRLASARVAALINGSASHAAEFDDIFRDALYHPGSPTIAAAWSLAEARDADELRLLKAIVAGYEVSTRIGMALQPSHYKYFHTTGTVGVFGSAAACSLLLGLPAGRAMHALATAGTFASGLQQAFRSDSMSKPLHAGHAAETGVTAALAAEAGVTGAPDLLEGPAGLGAAMCDQAQWSHALDGLGERFNIAQITFKNHGCCGHNFAAIDGTLALMRREGLTAKDIANIRIGTYKTAIEVCGAREVATVFESKFSLAYTVAAAVRSGSVRERAFEPEALADPAIAAIRNRVTLAVDEECDRAFPSRRSAVVEIQTRSGKTHRYLQKTRHGDPDDPLTDSELEEKFTELVAPRLGEGPARDMLTSIWAFGEDGAARAGRESGITAIARIWRGA